MVLYQKRLRPSCRIIFPLLHYVTNYVGSLSDLWIKMIFLLFHFKGIYKDIERWFIYLLPSSQSCFSFIMLIPVALFILKLLSVVHLISISLSSSIIWRSAEMINIFWLFKNSWRSFQSIHRKLNLYYHAISNPLSIKEVNW